MTVTFTDFPDETVHQIFENLEGDAKSLGSLNLTCRRLSVHATARLWNTFYIDVSWGDDDDFCSAEERLHRVCGAPHLCKLICVLREWEYHPDERTASRPMTDTTRTYCRNLPDWRPSGGYYRALATLIQASTSLREIVIRPMSYQQMKKSDRKIFFAPLFAPHISQIELDDCEAFSNPCLKGLDTLPAIRSIECSRA